MNLQGFEVELWNNFKAVYAASRMSMLQSGQLTINGKTMKFTYNMKGNRPSNGYTLIIGLHGGGGCPVEVNNQQFSNHKNLYDNQLPNGTIWLAPRACEDVWDMWFQDYVDDFLLQFIRAFAFNDLIDINKVFLTGYSAGGDGVYHLAPRMADHLAGAAMMAGHPNGINFMNIRNIGFSIQVGENDNDYNRKNEGIKYIRMLSQLGQNYGGFKHQSKIHPGKPHWMEKEDAKMFGWLFNFSRNPYPDVILFKQCPRRKQQFFYYLKIGETKNGKNDEETVVLKEGNTFKIFSNRCIGVRVNRKFINPSQPIRIVHNNIKTVERSFQPRREIAEKTLLEKIDPYFIFEDEFQSDPPSTIEMKSAICNIFSISQKEKDAEYEKSLPVKPDQTPASFSRSLQPLIPRTKPLNLLNQQLQQTGQILQGVQLGGQNQGNPQFMNNPQYVMQNSNQFQGYQGYQGQNQYFPNQWQQPSQNQWQQSNQNQWGAQGQWGYQTQQNYWTNQDSRGQNQQYQPNTQQQTQNQGQFQINRSQQGDCKIF